MIVSEQVRPQSPHEPQMALEPGAVPVQALDTFRLPAGLRGRSGAFVQMWWIVQQLLFAPSPQALYGWRRFLLRLFGARIGKGVIIRPSVRVTYPWKLTIGDHAWVGDNVELYTLDAITIGENAVVSQGSYLCTGTHDYTRPSFDMVIAPVTIEPEAWVASQVFVMPGVTVRRGAVVAVRSLVTRDVPPMAVAMGQPARVVGARRVADGAPGPR